MKKRKSIVVLTLFLLAGLTGCGSQTPLAGSASVPASAAPAPAASSVAASSSAEETAVPTGFTEAICYSFYTGDQRDTREWDRVPLYAEPDMASPCLTPYVAAINVVARQGNWVYGCWGDKMGWVNLSMTHYEVADEAFNPPLPLPDFMDDDQKVTFLKATNMFNVYIAHNVGLTGPLSDEVDSYDLDGKGWMAYRDASFDTYAEFDRAMHALFTDAYLSTHADSYREHDGKLYLVAGDRGSWECAVEGYTLTEQTDSRIAFDVNLIFRQKKGDSRCSLPCVMVKQENGWVFDDFTSAADDLRWMDAMGPDFDPWADKQS